MLLSREQLEDREYELLAPYAVHARDSRGREYNETEDPRRTCFQRDRDRIIHCRTSRRLNDKTQVVQHGDHFRSRLTHTLEVTQVSRDISRTIRLNEDLSEAIALAHDLGHTPSGHAGEAVLNNIMKQYGDGFEHNEQSLRVVTALERIHPDFAGLDLTWEIRDGLNKHRTSFDNPQSNDNLMPSLEAQVVNIADEIAYLCHDTDDGLRAGILHLPNLLKDLNLLKRVSATIDPSWPEEFRVQAMVSGMMRFMIEDLLQQTDALLTEADVKNIEQVYNVGRPLVGFSPDFYKECMQLKDYLYKHFYQSDKVSESNKKGQEVIQFLFEKLMDNIELVPVEFRSRLIGEPPHVIVKDYIAGMTDHFALSLYNKLNEDLPTM